MGRYSVYYVRVMARLLEVISALLALCAGNSPVTGEFPSQRPVTRSFDVFFDLRLNKRLSKQSRRWWFETQSYSLWRHGKATSAASTAEHYIDVIMTTMASQITSLTVVYSTVYSDADQRKHQKLCVTGLCVGNSPGPVSSPAQRASYAENVSIWWRHHENSHRNSICRRNVVYSQHISNDIRVSTRRILVARVLEFITH